MVGVADYGVFVELEPGVEGLVHVSEMSWSKRKQHPSKLVQVGDAAEVVVLEVRPTSAASLSASSKLRPILGLNWPKNIRWAQKVTGKVRSLTDFGAFVEIEEGFDGLVHVSDISWTGRLKNPGEVYKKGDEVKAKVLKIDAANRRVSLGVKQLNDLADWFKTHKVNDVVHGKVSRLTTFGAFVELAGRRGRPLSYLGNRGAPSRQAGTRSAGRRLRAGPGREYDFKIVEDQPDQHKIGLSYRAAVKHAERREVEDYRSSKSSSTATIGDAIKAKLGPSNRPGMG